MAALNYAAGYTLWLAALERGTRVGGAHRLPPLSYLLLVTAIALGWLLLHQPIGPGFWTGAALIAVGNLLVLWPERGGKDGTAARQSPTTPIEASELPR
jgi:drug/metabolite transporter (DMT)-like permease